MEDKKGEDGEMSGGGKGREERLSGELEESGGEVASNVSVPRLVGCAAVHRYLSMSNLT